MKYALTITSDPNAYDWGDTDTIIFTHPSKIMELPQTELRELISDVIFTYGKPLEVADEIARNDWYFIRNVDDVDVEIGGENA